MQSGSTDVSMYTVASKTHNVKVKKVVDPDVAAFLDEGDMARFDSDLDVEELEEDFVMIANQPEEGEKGVPNQKKVSIASCSHDALVQKRFMDNSNQANRSVVEKPRVRRLIDEQFDMLTLREYDSDTEESADYDAETEGEGEGDLLAAKLNHALKDHVMDDMDLLDKYEVPRSSANHGSTSDEELLDNFADLKKNCAEYAEMYSRENPDNTESLPFQESSSSEESGKWDCETIVSTYSNLDNHPGRIGAPSVPRKLFGDVSRNLQPATPIIPLQGKNMLPAEFLPIKRGKAALGKVKFGAGVAADEEKGRSRHTETKEEKKERKAAIKEERREARRSKKECKGMYKGEAKRAQHAAAVAGPNIIPLMQD